MVAPNLPLVCAGILDNLIGIILSIGTHPNSDGYNCETINDRLSETAYSTNHRNSLYNWDHLRVSGELDE